MKAQFGEDFRDNARLIGRLRLKAEQVKIHLCNERQRQDFFLEFPTPEIDEINYSLTPADFEAMLSAAARPSAWPRSTSPWPAPRSGTT